MEVAEMQAVDPGREFCGRCTGPMSTRVIVVDYSGLSSLRVAMFNRLRVPRALTWASNSVANVGFQQLATGMTTTWKHVRMRETRKQVKNGMRLVDGGEGVELRNVREGVAGKREPDKGKGNVA